MILLVKNPFFDKYHPEDMFYPGELVEVENAERAKKIVESNLAEYVNGGNPNRKLKEREELEAESVVTKKAETRQTRKK